MKTHRIGVEESPSKVSSRIRSAVLDFRAFDVGVTPSTFRRPILRLQIST